jgi:hypothetical protein
MNNLFQLKGAKLYFYQGEKQLLLKYNSFYHCINILEFQFILILTLCN